MKQPIYAISMNLKLFFSFNATVDTCGNLWYSVLLELPAFLITEFSFPGFTDETCRGMVAMRDVSFSISLHIDDF